MAGVLVAISIPIFTSQLEKAKEATDLANLRSAYAECSAALTETTAGMTSNGVTVTVENGVVTCTKTVTYVQGVSGWATTDAKIANIVPPAGTKRTTVTVKRDGSQATITANS